MLFRSVGALRDVAGDRAGECHTLPVRHGTSVAVWTALTLYVGAIGALLIAGLETVGWSGYQPALAVVALVGTTAFVPLVRQRHHVPAPVALHAHEVLVVERIALAGIAVSVGFGMRVAAALLVPMLVLTWWPQRRMRRFYELGAAAIPPPERNTHA